MSNERVSDERLAEMLVRVSPPDAGWQAGLPTMDVFSIITEIQHRRASVVTPEITGAAQFLIDRLDDFEGGSLGDSIEDACRDFDGHVSPAIERLRAALSVVSHETGDGETEAGPKLWGREPGSGHWVQIDDGSHTDAEVTSFEADYAAAGWTDLRRTNPFSASSPTDETQGVKREPVAWRYSSNWVTGPDMVKLWLHTADPALAARETSSGNCVLPLFTLSQLQAVERERDEAWAARNENAKLKGQRDAALAGITALRKIVSECAAALPNGAFISPDASLEFMAKLPAEIASVCARAGDPS